MPLTNDKIILCLVAYYAVQLISHFVLPYVMSCLEDMEKWLGLDKEYFYKKTVT